MSYFIANDFHTQLTHVRVILQTALPKVNLIVNRTFTKMYSNNPAMHTQLHQNLTQSQYSPACLVSSWKASIVAFSDRKTRHWPCIKGVLEWLCGTATSTPATQYNSGVVNTHISLSFPLPSAMIHYPSVYRNNKPLHSR